MSYSEIFDISVVDVGDVHVVRPTGELDMASAEISDRTARRSRQLYGGRGSLRPFVHGFKRHHCADQGKEQDGGRWGLPRNLSTAAKYPPCPGDNWTCRLGERLVSRVV